MPTSASPSRNRSCWPKSNICWQAAELRYHLHHRIALQRFLARFIMLHDGRRVVAAQHDVFLLEQHARHQPWRMDFLVAQSLQLRQVAADEAPRSIEFFRLRDRIEDAEIGLGVAAR